MSNNKDDSSVYVKKGSFSDLHINLKDMFNYYGKINPENKNIVIKINLCDFRAPETGAITDPRFLDVLLKCLRDYSNDNEIYVVESNATVAQPDLFIKWFGFIPVLSKWNATYVNLSKQKTFKKDINGLHFKEIDVPEVFRDSYFISLSKLKTHFEVKLSSALKNQFGCIPKRRKIVYHPHIHDVIVDVNLAMRPDFSIVDGIIALGDYGPTIGEPIPANVIVGGRDPVSVDCVCAKIIGYNPYLIEYIRKCANNGVGSMKYSLIGDSLNDINVDFKVGLRKRTFNYVLNNSTSLIKKFSGGS